MSFFPEKFSKIFTMLPDPTKGNDAEFTLNIEKVNTVDQMISYVEENAPNDTILDYMKNNVFSLLQLLVNSRKKLVMQPITESLKSDITAIRKRYYREYVLMFTTLYTQSGCQYEDFRYIYTKLLPIVSAQNFELEEYGKGYESIESDLKRKKADEMIETVKKFAETKRRGDDFINELLEL